MKVSRGTALAALVFVAVAAPVTAFALSDDDHDITGSEHAQKGHDKADKAHDDADDNGHGDEKSAPGRAHAQAMKDWAHCVGEAASGPKAGDHTGPPKEACGDKPVGPGRAKHAGDSSAPGHSGDHRPSSPGRSGR